LQVAEQLAAAVPAPAVRQPAPLARVPRVGERAVEVGLFVSALATVLTTFGILATLAVETVGFFQEVTLAELLLDTQWTPLFADKHFGIWPLVAGTMLTSGVAIGFAMPFGLLAAIYLSEFASKRSRRILKPALELLAGVPSIVFGYFALVVLTPILQQFIPRLAGFNALSAGLVIGLMIVPTIASLSEDALRAVPTGLREGAYGLGASKLATIFQVVLPSASGGVMASIILALSRAVGETMVVAIAAGQQARLTFDPRVPIETMTAYIVQVSMGDTPTGTIEYRTIFVVGSVLFLITFAMNIVGYRLTRNRGWQ